MLHDIIFLVLGIALLIGGGNYLTDGATAVARRFHVSGLMIGLTVVAFGSSMPDLVVCLMATVSGKTPMALGDIVGANIFDILLVFGIVALIKPLKATPTMLRTGLPMLFLSGLILFILGDDKLIDNGTADIINRSDGLVMIAFMVLFMVMSIRGQKGIAPETDAENDRPADSPAPAMKQWLAWICIVGGLGALVIGGNWVVDGASGLARKFGMSESLVGLTVVAIGSSLPDLAASVIAAVKGQPGLAVGNIVGACVLNVFTILGICATIRPLQTSTITWIDFTTLAAGAGLVWIFSRTGRRLSRWEGVTLVALYCGYMTYLVLAA